MRINLTTIKERIRASASEFTINRHGLRNAWCIAKEYLGPDVTERDVEQILLGNAYLTWADPELVGNHAGDVEIVYKQPRIH